jgi:hypothetical protein
MSSAVTRKVTVTTGGKGRTTMTDKRLVRREAPARPLYALAIESWYEQCGADLAAGKHAIGCACTFDKDRDRDASGVEYEILIPVNGCPEIARRMLAFEGYEVTE